MPILLSTSGSAFHKATIPHELLAIKPHAVKVTENPLFHSIS
jgi:hypothetical protein